MSLIAGSAFGGVSALAAYNQHDQLMLGASSVLAVIMSFRFYNSGKLMPAGIVAVLRFQYLNHLDFQ